MSSRALITGASSGIGAAVAKRLAQRSEVWLAARRADRLTAEVDAIRAAGGTAHAVVMDVSRPDETAAQVEALDREVGGFDLVLANAGIGGGGRVPSGTTYAHVRDVFTTNTLGALATLLPVVPAMIERAKGGRRGHIAAVSSLAGELAIPIAAEYGASKAALTFFLEGALGELPGKGVDVTIIHPGFIKTDLTAGTKFPMPFMLELDEAAAAIDEGLAARAQFVRFPQAMTLLVALGRAVPRRLRNGLVGSRAGAG